MKKHIIVLCMLLFLATFACASIQITATVLGSSQFDTITNFAPFNPITIYSARAPFSVTAGDNDGVAYCTFQIYKNGIKVFDVNGTTTGINGNGLWSYIYTDLDRGNNVYAKVFCVDKTGESSNTLQSALYTASGVTFDIGMNTPGGGGSINLSPYPDNNIDENIGMPGTGFFALSPSEGENPFEYIEIFSLFILIIACLYFVMKDKF